MGDEEPLKDRLREDVKLLVFEVVPVKDDVIVWLSVLVLLWVGGGEPVLDTEAVCVDVIVTEGVFVTAPVLVVVFVRVWVLVPVIVTLGLAVRAPVPDTEGLPEGLLVTGRLGVLDAVTVGLAVREAVLVRVRELV